MRDDRQPHDSQSQPRGLRLGERLRQLRVAAGLTQSELAGDRFSKEYVSQIERGKTRPTARRSSGSPIASASTPASSRAASPPTSAPGSRAPSPAPRRCTRRRRTRRPRRPSSRSPRPRARPACPSCRFARSSGAGSRRCASATTAPALELLNEARAISEAESFSDVERADVLLWLGGCRYQLNSIADGARPLQRGARARRALGPAVRRAQGEHPLLALALLAASARLRGGARGRRARARARRAGSTTCARSAPRTSRLRSSPTARATGCSPATTPSARARRTRELADRVHVSQLTNNLGGLNFLLGKTDQAVELLKESFAIALELGRDADAGRAVSSLAQVHLRTGERRAGRGAGAPGARAALRPGRLRRRGRERAARARPRRCSSRDGSTRPRRPSPPPRPASASSDRVAIALPHGLRAATLPLDGGITNGRPSSIARPQRRSRTFASRERKEVTDLTKARLIYLLLIASLFAYFLACVHGVWRDE